MRRWRRAGTLLLTLFLIASLLALPVQAAGTYTLNVPVQYSQSTARTAAELVNRYRSAKLSYDSTLESLAMRRAVEAAVCQEHGRPDGTAFYTIAPSAGLRGECIAFGTPTAADVVNQFLSSSAHRRILLDSGANCIGVGHAVVDGRHFWAVLVGSTGSAARAASAENSSATVAVKVSSGVVTTTGKLNKTSLTLTDGQQAALPGAEVTVIGTYYDISIPVTPTWKSSNTAVVTVSGTKVTAVAAGTTTLKATLPGGKVLSLPVTVKQSALARAEVTLSASSMTYTGTARKPSVTVRLGGKTLRAGTDYTVSYQNNVNGGIARVIVTGRGSYPGSVTKTFTIKTAKPSLTKVENVSGGVKLTWAGTPGASAYRVWYRTGTGSWTKIGDTTGTSLIWKGAVSGRQYDFAIRTVAAVGSGTATSALSERKSLLCLAHPTLSGLKSTAARSFTVSWSKVGGAAGYQVQYSTDKGFTAPTTVTVTGALSRRVSALKSGTTYYVRLRTCARVDGVSRFSAWSPVSNVKVK